LKNTVTGSCFFELYADLKLEDLFGYFSKINSFLEHVRIT